MTYCQSLRQVDEKRRLSPASPIDEFLEGFESWDALLMKRIRKHSKEDLFVIRHVWYYQNGGMDTKTCFIRHI